MRILVNAIFKIASKKIPLMRFYSNFIREIIALMEFFSAYFPLTTTALTEFLLDNAGFL